MSKRQLKKALAQNKVQAVFRKFKKVRGEVTNIPLYDIYGPAGMKRRASQGDQRIIH